MEKPHRTAIYWFRRALRLDDNRSLRSATHAARHVVPVFILDPKILTRPETGAARVRFLFESLAALDAELRQRGGRLILRQGEPVTVLEQLVEETGATLLSFADDYSPYSRERDNAVQLAMTNRGVTVETENDHLLIEPGEILSASTSTPYTVYTPYKNRWFLYPVNDPVLPPERIPTPNSVQSEPLPTVPEQYGVLKQPGQNPQVIGGEIEGRRHLDDFLRRSVGIREYATERDRPGVEGTSRLSAYLRSGALSVRRVAHSVRKAREGHAGQEAGFNTFLSELAWRDFYYQILWHFPHVATGAFKPMYDALQWENDEALFAAWCEGRTGYPIVDAAMRQLRNEAWMHNRARMIVASFLTKDLLIDWRLGERYFMQMLIDGDQAPNNGGWQWAAGTGTDAQPYFRIFNPTSQGEKFDPTGDYVRRYVPELAQVPTKVIHQPWLLSASEQEFVGCVLGRDYPHPIVDHRVQREKALALYRRVRTGEDIE